ncbi:MAG: ATP synthase F0 subunit B [Planctomycetota bacterium]|nr:MAG: ATP synthase F0 subunit B [Planctomycetota bacterium]
MAPLLVPVLAAEEGGGLSAIFEVGQSAYLWTIAIFLLALLPMWKFVFGPITRALDDRELKTREAAKAAEAAREEAKRVQAAIQEDLERARQEAARQVAEARARAEVREKEMLAAAAQHAAAERQRAQEEIGRSLAAARETLRGDAVALGIQVAEKVIEREFSDSDQARLEADLEQEMARR